MATQAPPPIESGAREANSAPVQGPGKDVKRVESWTHYYEYFHMLDANMQVWETHSARCLSVSFLSRAR